jgi:hypothetical protein
VQDLIDSGERAGDFRAEQAVGVAYDAEFHPSHFQWKQLPIPLHGLLRKLPSAGGSGPRRRHWGRPDYLDAAKGEAAALAGRARDLCCCPSLEKAIQAVTSVSE